MAQHFCIPLYRYYKFDFFLSICCWGFKQLYPDNIPAIHFLYHLDSQNTYQFWLHLSIYAQLAKQHLAFQMIDLQIHHLLHLSLSFIALRWIWFSFSKRDSSSIINPADWVPRLNLWGCFGSVTGRFLGTAYNFFIGMTTLTKSFKNSSVW